MREREWRKLMRDLDDAEAAYASERRGDMEELIDFIRRGLQAIQEEQKATAELLDTILYDAAELDARLRDLEKRLNTPEEATAP
ncbi:MAG: hypothetical protein ACXQT3_05540 [Methermicoccaceae archaeon]